MRPRWTFESFPFGYAPFVLLVGTLVAAGWLALHPVPGKTATLTFWTFAKNHYDAYCKLVPSFQRRHPGVTVDVQLVHGEAVTRRLQAAFWGDVDVPDLVEVEISFAGSFFRGPESQIGFVDLGPYLRSSGLYDRIVRSRFAPYTHKGHIYGLPHDVHPVMLAYRRDIFEQEGIDAGGIRTWDDFIRIGRKVTRPGDRYMIEMTDRDASIFQVLLFQRGGGYFDADGNLIMDDEAAVETMKWYIPLVAGPGLIATDIGGGQVFTQALETGYVLTFFCPDWRTKLFQMDAPRMSGKMALMPLPAFRPGGRRTSTWGGTMLGITKKCRHKELAWELAKHMYFDPEVLADNFREMNILPPLKAAWTQPAFGESRAYWSGQRIGALYIALADDVPPHYTGPYYSAARTQMDMAVAACAAFYRAHGPEGFDDFVRKTLHDAAGRVRMFMDRNPFR